MHLTLCIYNTLGVSNNYSCMDTFFSYNEKKKKKEQQQQQTEITNLFHPVLIAPHKS